MRRCCSAVITALLLCRAVLCCAVLDRAAPLGLRLDLSIVASFWFWVFSRAAGWLAGWLARFWLC